MTGVALGGTLDSPMLDTELQIRRLSVDDVYKMGEAGVFEPEERFELIDGVLVRMMKPSAGHSQVVERLTAHFVNATGDLRVRIQDMLIVEGGFLMPDLMVIEPPPPGKQPSAARLVVEVSVSTKRHDRWKADRYARSRVDEYWIVAPDEQRVAVHRDPREGAFRTIVEYGPGEEVPTRVGAPPVVVATLLGEAVS